MNYQYGRIKKLAESLAEAGIAGGIVEAIMAGGESVRQGSKPAAKSDWMRGAMARMDELLDEPTRRAVREACACCLTGRRLEISKGIGKKGGSLADRVAAANKAQYVFGNGVELLSGDRVRVKFNPDGQESYRCVCLPQAKEPISITYCYCCGGHIKHHLQNVLGRKLQSVAETSALSSGGKQDCSFTYKILD